MQFSLFDFLSNDPREKIVARLRILAREIMGEKARIEKISICRNCSEYAIVRGYVETVKREIIVFPVGNRLEDGMHQEVYYPRKRKEFNLLFRIEGSEVEWIGNGGGFHGEICPRCFLRMKEEMARKAVSIAYKLLLDAKTSAPPFESYWSHGKFVIRLPGRRYSFVSKDELMETVEGKIYDLIYESLSDTVALEDVVDGFRRKIDVGDWRILELLVLVQCLDMKGKMRNVNCFGDIVSFVAFVEKRDVKDLLLEFDRYGMFFGVSGIVGFTVEGKERLSEFRKILPRRISNEFRYRDIIWRVPSIYLKFLPPLGFWIGEHDILRIKTKHCIMYVAPCHKQFP